MRVVGWVRVGAAVAARPRLWGVGWTQARRLAPSGWWRRRPLLPVPDRDWMAFRMRTAYGDPRHVPPPADVVAWLDWCRQWDRLRYPQRQ